MLRTCTASSALGASLLAGALLLAPGAAAGSLADPARCAALQGDADAYRRGEVQYLTDPTPAWSAEAERYGCTGAGLSATAPTDLADAPAR